MKVLRKNQLIVLVISLILMTAGYLNFTNQSRETTEISALGDATLVSVEAIENKVEENVCIENQIDANNSIENQMEVNAIETNNNVQEDNYFKESKLERENMYSQMLETYQEIYNNVNASTEQKSEAIEKIAEINNKKNAIMIAENLVQAKGFEDVVIFWNTDSISVIVKKEILEQEEIAQIQNIISRELGALMETINISTK